MLKLEVQIIANQKKDKLHSTLTEGFLLFFILWKWRNTRSSLVIREFPDSGLCTAPMLQHAAWKQHLRWVYPGEGTVSWTSSGQKEKCLGLPSRTCRLMQAHSGYNRPTKQDCFSAAREKKAKSFVFVMINNDGIAPRSPTWHLLSVPSAKGRWA